MKTPFDCALNGVLLSSLDEAICVQDIREEAPKLRTSALSLPMEGQRLLRQQRESLTVQVIFAIHAEDPVRRRAVLQNVLAWAAQGGLLTTLDRPGQQLSVLCTALPAMSAEDWAAPLTLSFTSVRVPYWEATDEVTVSGSAVLTLDTPGTAESAPVDVVVINDTTSLVDTLTLYCGGTRMEFTDLHLPSSGMFLLLQSGGILSAQVAGRSVLPCRTPESDDLLLAPCGRSCVVYASAAEPLQATFTVRGRYL